MKKNTLFDSPEDFESPIEKLIRQDRDLMKSLEPVTKSPMEAMIERERALMASLESAAESPIEKMIRQQQTMMSPMPDNRIEVMANGMLTSGPPRDYP